MRFNLVLGTLLCIITWMSLSHATHGPAPMCCATWTPTRPKLENIKRYTRQSGGVCPIEAVVFHTVRGKRLCSNPSVEWVKDAILKLDNDKKAREMKEERSTRDTTPAFSSTSYNTPQMKSRSTKQRGKDRRRRMCS